MSRPLLLKRATVGVSVFERHYIHDPIGFLCSESGRVTSTLSLSQTLISSRCPVSSCSTWWTGPAGPWLLFVCGYVCVCDNQAQTLQTRAVSAWIGRSICFLYLTVPSWVFVKFLLKCDLSEHTRRAEQGKHSWKVSLENPASFARAVQPKMNTLSFWTHVTSFIMWNKLLLPYSDHRLPSSRKNNKHHWKCSSEDVTRRLITHILPSVAALLFHSCTFSLSFSWLLLSYFYGWLIAHLLIIQI